MKKKILITSFDLEIGGVERSLIGLLNTIDYTRYDIDLFLYAHDGELMPCIPPEVNLLAEISSCSMIKQPIAKALGRAPLVGMARLFSKLVGFLKRKLLNISGDMLVQNCRFCLPFWPSFDKEYDLALSFATPHYFATDRARSKKTAGWIHSDYQNCGVDRALELAMWGRLDVIAAVSDSVKDSFAQVFPEVADKLLVIENIISPEFIREQAEEDVSADMPEIIDETRICSVGRFCHAKNFDSIPEVVVQLNQLGIRVRWYLIGFGGDEHLIQTKIKEADVESQVVILGKKTNPYPYIKACDIYVQPSRYEGKAVTVREAQILGKPVLITNFPTAQSQLGDGVDGHICPLSVEGVVAGIILLVEDHTFRNQIAVTAASRDYSNRTELNEIISLIGQ